MNAELSRDFFTRLQEQILTDIRATIRARAADHGRSRAYGFVIYFQPGDGSVGWRFHDSETDRSQEPSGFTFGPGHPDGPRFDVGDCLADPPISGATQELLEEFTAVNNERLDNADDDEPDLELEERFTDVLVACIDALAPDLATIPTTDDFVAFISDYDIGADELVKRTVPADRLRRVFPQLED